MYSSGNLQNGIYRLSSIIYHLQFNIAVQSISYSSIDRRGSTSCDVDQKQHHDCHITMSHKIKNIKIWYWENAVMLLWLAFDNKSQTSQCIKQFLTISSLLADLAFSWCFQSFKNYKQLTHGQEHQLVQSVV